MIYGFFQPLLERILRFPTEYALGFFVAANQFFDIQGSRGYGAPQNLALEAGKSCDDVR